MFAACLPSHEENLLKLAKQVIVGDGSNVGSELRLQSHELDGPFSSIFSALQV
jgi:hypothetical protein